MEIRMKIGFRNRGIYDSGEEYDILDIVAADNALYISRKAENKGHDLTETEWWQKSIGGTGGGGGGVTEQELQDVLKGYWKQAELTVIPTETIEALN